MPTTMKSERRRVSRNRGERSVVRVELKDGMGHARWVTADLVDRSDHGLSVSLLTPLKPGSGILVIGKFGEVRAEIRRRATVSWCQEGSDGAFRVGLEFPDGKAGAQGSHQIIPPDPLALDYYELMQLSPNADAQTIERVYRMLAQRYHPDNIQTGSSEMFIQLSEAHRIVSDPELRAGYDARHREAKRLHWKIFDQTQASTGHEAEKRKRRGILSLLHAKTLQNPERAAIGILEFEELLGCPREHLEAALWYLRGKGYIQRGDNGRCTITVEGFDEVEQSGASPGLEKRQLTERKNEN